MTSAPSTFQGRLRWCAPANRRSKTWAFAEARSRKTFSPDLSNGLVFLPALWICGDRYGADAAGNFDVVVPCSRFKVGALQTHIVAQSAEGLIVENKCR